MHHVGDSFHSFFDSVFFSSKLSAPEKLLFIHLLFLFPHFPFSLPYEAFWLVLVAVFPRVDTTTETD